MFVKKEIYNDLIKDNFKLNKMNKILEDRIKLLKCEKEELKTLNNELEEEIVRLEKRNETLELSVQDLARENEKLVDWVNKIINDIGCYQVNERSVKIPVMECMGNSYEPCIGKKVTIPEISFYKVERR